MVENIEKIKEYKNKYIENKYIGGEIICDFFLIKKDDLDVIDCKNEVIKEYIYLISQRLQSRDVSLIMLINTEIEKCLIDKQEEIYEYLIDEIYKHLNDYNAEYPQQAVGLHIDILLALADMGENDLFFKYIYELEDTYKQIYGEDSYVFCRNWCHILYEVFLPLLPNDVEKQYDKYKSVFEKNIDKETILYILIMTIANEKSRKTENIEYFNYALNYCNRLKNKIPESSQKEINKFLTGVQGVHDRSEGNLDTSTSNLKFALTNTDDVLYKLFLICQIASIMYKKYDFKEMYNILNDNKNIIEDNLIDDIIIAEYYNMWGLYYTKTGYPHEAVQNFESAIKKAEEILGTESDLSFKYKLNCIICDYQNGHYEGLSDKVNDILEKVIIKPERYKETLPLLFNNIVALFSNNRDNTDKIIILQNAIKNKNVINDKLLYIFILTNLYAILCSNNNMEGKEFSKIEEEVCEYYRNYSNSDGYLSYLYARLSKSWYKGDLKGQLACLNEIKIYFEKYTPNIVCKDYYDYYITQLKINLFCKSWKKVEKKLESMWEDIFYPIFRYIATIDGYDFEAYVNILRLYMSVYISIVRQCSYIDISEKQLYEMILNYKYYEDLMYKNRTRFIKEIQKNKYFKLNDINIKEEWLILDEFDYFEIDIKNVLFCIKNTEQRNAKIFFAITHNKNIFLLNNVKVMGDILYSDLFNMCSEFYDFNGESRLELKTQSQLKEYVKGKNTIYICGDLFANQILLTMMKINGKMFWGEKYQIIYCNVIQDVREDIEIRDISNGIYFGMSNFGTGNVKNEINNSLNELPYVLEEAEAFNDITGGKIYVNSDIPENLLTRRTESIIHISTHTIDDNREGNTRLIIGKDDMGGYVYAEYNDISNCKWDGVKLVILSACETNIYDARNLNRNSLSHAVRNTGALYTISTVYPVEDGTGLFFMITFYKSLKQYKKIGLSFFMTQRIMRTLTKKEILLDETYIKAGMKEYLYDFDDDMIPFENEWDWGTYVLNLN